MYQSTSTTGKPLKKNQKVEAVKETVLGLHLSSINTGSTAAAVLIAKTVNDMGVRSAGIVYQYPSYDTVTAYAIREL
ncbi:MAG: hypothetical protein Fur0011_5170 [Candidatus Microgenomates bacterium]